MKYVWDSITFDAPAGRDDSTILLMDSGPTPQWNLSVRHDALPEGNGAFATFVASQPTPTGATRVASTARTVNGRGCTVLEHHMKQPGGSGMRQHQALVDRGDGAIVVTMTSTDAAQQIATAAFERVLDTLTWGART